MSYARVNWKSMQESAIPSKPSHWTWQKPRGGRSSVKFIPNPSTTEKLVRVKIGGRKRLYRAPRVRVVAVKVRSAEDNGCTATALSSVTNVPASITLAALARAGRKPRRGFEILDGAKRAKIAGFTFKRVLGRPVSLSKFIADHPVGRFYLVTCNHAFALVNGKVLDNLPSVGGTRRILGAYTVKSDWR